MYKESENRKKEEKACYIVGAGGFDGLQRIPQNGDLIIAADGGYEYLKREEIVPDVLIGDFDSLGYLPEHEHILHHSPIKDDTDMALAAEYGKERGYRRFYLYGGLGGSRLDHTVANFQLVTGLSKAGMEVYLIGEDNIVTALTNERIFFSKKMKGMISVFSMDTKSKGIWERGLKYTLENAEMSNDKTLGVSNEFTGEASSIEVADGTLLLMWERQEEQPLSRECVK